MVATEIILPSSFNQQVPGTPGELKKLMLELDAGFQELIIDSGPDLPLADSEDQPFFLREQESPDPIFTRPENVIRQRLRDATEFFRLASAQVLARDPLLGLEIGCVLKTTESLILDSRLQTEEPGALVETARQTFRARRMTMIAHNAKRVSSDEINPCPETALAVSQEVKNLLGRSQPGYPLSGFGDLSLLIKSAELETQGISEDDKASLEHILSHTFQYRLVSAVDWRALQVLLNRGSKLLISTLERDDWAHMDVVTEIDLSTSGVVTLMRGKRSTKAVEAEMSKIPFPLLEVLPQGLAVAEEEAEDYETALLEIQARSHLDRYPQLVDRLSDLDLP
jgi:hypothetical protein